MTLTHNYAGCDVSKAHLDLCLLAEPAPLSARFDNTAKGRAALIALCKARGVHAVVYEPSGGYERPLRADLEIAKLPGIRVNARRVRDFARSLGILAKTDRVDARVLARFGDSLKPSPTPPPKANILNLQAFVRRRSQIVAQRKEERQRLSTCEHPCIKADIERAITELTQRIKQMEHEIKALIADDDALQDRAHYLASVPGLGRVSIAVLLTEMPELGALPKGRPASLIGVAPHARDSGHWRGKRTCWGGRKAVRDVLYMASLSAIRKVPKWKALYTRLRQAGKPHKLAAIAVVRHIIETLNVILRKKQMFKA